MKKSLLPVGALAGALVLAGCAGPAGTDAADNAPTETAKPAFEVRAATAEQVLREVRNRGGRVTLVNVWATWCEPCLEEMPDILKVHGELAGRGMELILVSGDFDGQKDQVVAFLAEQGVDFPSFIKEGDDEIFINGMSEEWTGTLPASFLFDAGGNEVDFWEGIVSYEQLKEKVLHILDETVSSS